MKTAWQALVAFGAVLVVTSGCEITVDDDPDFEEGGSTFDRGGKTSSGGKSSGGTSSGGASNGGSTSGGKASSGGASSGGATFSCSNVDRVGTPASSCTFADENINDPRDGKCYQCLQQTAECCGFVKSCFASPSNACSVGSDGRTEFLCYQDCLYRAAQDAGGLYSENDMDICAEECATCSNISTVAQDLIICMHENCEDDCFLPPE